MTQEIVQQYRPGSLQHSIPRVDPISMSTAQAEAAPMEPHAISRTPLLTAVIDGQKIVERIEIKQIVLSPNQATGLHLHPCPVVGIITKGSIYFQVENQPVCVLDEGDAFYEPANTKIPRFDARDEGVTFVAYYLLGAGDRVLIKMLE